jgi:hypothetical protein
MFQFLKSFMSKFSSPIQTDAVAVAEPLDTLTPLPSEALFTEQQPPVDDVDSQEEHKPLRDFLSENFAFQGRRAGYEHHNLEYMHMHIQDLRARFRSACDRHIQVLENDLIAVKTLHIQLGDALPSELAILQLRIDKINSNMEEIRLQKVLSVENEGLISEAVQAYTIGFHQGLKDYVSEVKFGNHDLL